MPDQSLWSTYALADPIVLEAPLGHALHHPAVD